MKKNWEYKKQLSGEITNDKIEEMVATADINGALGCKISGAGGGGFFTFYCEEKQTQLRTALKQEGLRELRYDFDFEGTKVLANFMNYRATGYNG